MPQKNAINHGQNINPVCFQLNECPWDSNSFQTSHKRNDVIGSEDVNIILLLKRGKAAPRKK